MRVSATSTFVAHLARLECPFNAIYPIIWSFLHECSSPNLTQFYNGNISPALLDLTIFLIFCPSYILLFLSFRSVFLTFYFHNFQLNCLSFLLFLFFLFLPFSYFFAHLFSKHSDPWLIPFLDKRQIVQVTTTTRATRAHE